MLPVIDTDLNDLILEKHEFISDPIDELVPVRPRPNILCYQTTRMAERGGVDNDYWEWDLGGGQGVKGLICM